MEVLLYMIPKFPPDNDEVFIEYRDSNNRVIATDSQDPDKYINYLSTYHPTFSIKSSSTSSIGDLTAFLGGWSNAVSGSGVCQHHNKKEYIGFRESYYYCADCGEKLND
jgi:hypothetical protein